MESYGVNYGANPMRCMKIMDIMENRGYLLLTSWEYKYIKKKKKKRK